VRAGSSCGDVVDGEVAAVLLASRLASALVAVTPAAVCCQVCCCGGALVAEDSPITDRSIAAVATRKSVAERIVQTFRAR